MQNIDYVLKYRNSAKLSKEQIVEILCPTDIDWKLVQLRGDDCSAPNSCDGCWSLPILSEGF